jgi:hypothetical protein
MANARVSAASVRIICRGSVADIRMTNEVYGEYIQAIDGKDKISVKRKTRLLRYFGEFANNVDFYMRLGEDKFMKVGYFKSGGGGTIAVWEFKAFQWRLYGGISEVDGRRCFVAVAVDPDKKSNRANRQLLEIAAKRLAGFSDFTSRT